MLAKCWKIYFNYGRRVSDVKGNVQFEFLNGDLYRLVPEGSFGMLQPGQSHRIEYVASGEAVNFLDAPSGFYMVWDGKPMKGIVLHDYTVKPLSFANFEEHLFTEDIYQRNKETRDIPEEELVKMFPIPIDYKLSAGYFMSRSICGILWFRSGYK